PLKFTYIYTNNSDFVFKPEGEVRITDGSSNQVTDRVQINESQKALYPGEEIRVTKEDKTWKDIKEAFGEKIVTSRTYNGFTENFITNEVKVSIKEPLLIGGGVTLLTAGAILSSTLSALSKKIRNSKKSKEQ